MTTETSNAREPDVAMALHWIDRYAAGIDDDCQIDLVAEALGVTLPDGYAAAPPPAAARGDVRGLVAKWRGDAQDCSSKWDDGYSTARRISADELESALAAEGVHCDSCNGSGVVVTYVDPYERGDVSSPEQSPCPDCAEGVQAGEVE